MEDRIDFLSHVSFFKNWDSYRLYRVAHNLTQIDLNRGCDIIKNDEISRKIYFVLRGRVDLFSSSHSKTALLSIQKYEYFGESGFMNVCTHNNTKTPNQFVETFCMKASTRVDLLILPESQFYLLDRNTIDLIAENFYARKIWREIRNTAVSQEIKVFRDFKNKLRSDSLVNTEKKSNEREKEKGNEKRGDTMNRHNFLTPLSQNQNNNYYSSQVNGQINSQLNNSDSVGQRTPKNPIHFNTFNSLSYQPSMSLSASSNAFIAAEQSDYSSSSSSDRHIINHSKNNTNLNNGNDSDNNVLGKLDHQQSRTLQTMTSNSIYNSNSNFKSNTNSLSDFDTDNRSVSTDSILATRSSPLNFYDKSNFLSKSDSHVLENGTGTGTKFCMANIHSDKYASNSKYLSSGNVPHLLNLEDIPSLLDHNFSPLMRLSTANKNKSGKIYKNFIDLKKSNRTNQTENIKIQRELAVMKQKSKVENLDNVDSSCLTNRSSSTSTSTSLTDVIELVRNHSLGLSVILRRALTDNNDVINNGSKDFSKSNIDGNKHEDVLEKRHAYNDEYISKTGFESSMLFGSGRIPSVKSYCETLTSSDRYPRSNNNNFMK